MESLALYLHIQVSIILILAESFHRPLAQHRNLGSNTLLPQYLVLH